MRQDVCEAEHAYNYREPQYRAVPNPRTTDGKAFVADPDHLLSADERNAIQEAAEQLHTLTGVEMVTVLLDDIGEADAFDFAYDLFNEWGIGDSETNTGVLHFRRRCRWQMVEPPPSPPKGGEIKST